MRFFNLHRILTWSLIIGFFVLACEERYFPPIDSKYDNVLVVDGMITSDPGPYVVKLSSSVQVDAYETTPLSGFQLTVSDDAGASETLLENEPGVYTTAADGIQGIAGRSYQLRMQSPNGKTYLSDFERLDHPVGIDTIYPKPENIVDPDLIYDIEGYQFYISTKPAENDSTYFLWNLTGTYEYQADFIIRWIFDGTLRQFTNSDSLRTCWNTRKVKDIFLFSTAGLSSNVLEAYPLNYVSTQTRELSIRYSLLVEQLTVSEAAFNFWSSIKEQNSGAGELYSKQPYQIHGNIYNPDNDDELVLGYFMAVGKTSQRIFVNRPKPPVTMRYPICTLHEVDYMNFGTIVLSRESEWPVYATFDNNGANALPGQECMDCTLSDGTIVMPEFWTYE